MLVLSSMQSSAFAGFATKAPSKVDVRMQFGGFGGFGGQKKAAAPAFAYGLPGNFNALGGGEFNWDPAGFLKGKCELDGQKLKAETALRPDYVPGDLGFDPLNLLPEDPAEAAEMKEKELAHARLGMIAAAGFLAQEAVTKATWGTAYGLPDF